MGNNKRSNLVNVGRIGSPFGIKGWVKVASYTEPVENIVSYSPWWLKTRHGVRPVEIDEYRHHNESLTVLIKGVGDRDQAASLNLVDIAVDKGQMPALEIGEYYWHQLVGLEVTANDGEKETCIGRVKGLMETGANDVLVVEPSERSIDDRERLVPYIPDIYVKSVDIENGNISVLWDPEY